MREIILNNRLDFTYFLSGEQEANEILSGVEIKKSQSIRTYHSKDIQQRAKVLPMQIKHWTNTRVIIPLEAVRGTGRAHVYDHQNLVEALVCRELNRFSININVMRDTLNFIREREWEFVVRMDLESNSYTKTVIDNAEKYHLKQVDLFKNIPTFAKKDEFITAMLEKKYEDAKVIINVERGHVKKVLKTCLNDYQLLREEIDESFNGESNRYIAKSETVIENSNLWDFVKYYPLRQDIYLVLWMESWGIEGAHKLESGLNLHIATDQMDEILSRCKSNIVINLANLFYEAGPFL